MVTKKCEWCGGLFSKCPSYFKNRPGRFCSKNCELKQRSKEWSENNPMQYIDNSGEKNPMWGKQGWNYDPNGAPRHDGYYRITVNGKRVLKHRYLMEKKLGRKLSDDEIVHHIDGDNTNNNLDNLKVLTQSEHCKNHRENGRFVSLKNGGHQHDYNSLHAA